MKILITVLLSFIMPLIILIRPIRKHIENKENLKEFIKSNKFEIILFFILIIGSLVRVCGIDKMPNALNVDEASSGYEAYSIMKYGIDRNGNSYPVFLYSWGEGQNALLSYIMIPFIAIIGLSEFSIRLPMAIIGIISLYAFYYLLKNIFDNKKIALLGVTFLAITPWHIMKSRWGLESNIFPDLILLSFLMLTLGLKNKKQILKILSFVILGVSAYAYSTSYLFLPIYVLGTLGYLIYKKQISVKEAILYLGIVFIVSLPIILYVIINMFNLNQITILNITIPKLKLNRYESTTTIFSGKLIENCLQNLKNLALLLITQSDNLNWNALPAYGICYIVSIPFFIIGVRTSKKEYSDNLYNQIIKIWMISSVILAMFCIININRINIIFLPCIYYVVLGIYQIIKKYEFVRPLVIIMYATLFSLFILEYSKQDFNEYLTFTSGVKELSDYCKEADSEQIYCYYSFKEPYIYMLFYQEYDTNDFIKTVEHFRNDGKFDDIKAFGKYRFYLPKEINENSLVVVPKNSNINYNLEYKNKLTINQFDVYEY